MAALGAFWGAVAPAVPGHAGAVQFLGDEVVMRFNTVPPEDHGRIVIGHVDADDYVCLTPDNDMWIETLIADGADVLLLGMRPNDRTMPFHFPADGTYFHDFANLPTVAQQDGLLFLGQTAANAERIVRGLVAAPVVGGGAAAGGGGAGPGLAPPIAGGVAGGAVGPGAAGGLAGAGAVVPVLGPGPGPGVGGGAAAGIGAVVLPLAGAGPGAGAAGLAGLGAAAGAAVAPPPPVGGGAPAAPGVGFAGWVAPLGPPPDQRVMNVKYDHAGKRYREARDALTLMQAEELWDDWPIKGPRTVRWVINHMIVHGGTPRGWHQRWMAEMKLSTSDAGVDIHEMSCHALELMLCYDQFHIGNSAAAEKLARDLQMQEERYADRVTTAKEGSEEAAIFGGLGTRGNLCICPELKAHVAEELKSITSVAKERRKAREERGLAKPNQKQK